MRIHRPRAGPVDPQHDSALRADEVSLVYKAHIFKHHRDTRITAAKPFDLARGKFDPEILAHQHPAPFGSERLHRDARRNAIEPNRWMVFVRALDQLVDGLVIRATVLQKRGHHGLERPGKAGARKAVLLIEHGRHRALARSRVAGKPDQHRRAHCGTPIAGRR